MQPLPFLESSVVQNLSKDSTCENVTGETCFLMNSELAIERQQVSPEVQIEWKIKGDRHPYLFFF